MVAYGLFTSRKEKNRQRYRSDKFYRGTFTILVFVLLLQVFVVLAACALFVEGNSLGPEAQRNESRLKRLTSEEEQYAPLLRKLGILASLKPLIANRIPAARLISDIEGAFFANEQVALTELKLSNAFDPNDPNSKDDFSILISGSIKATGGSPTVILTEFTKTLADRLPKGASVGVARNAVIQGEEVFVPFDLKIHYANR